MKFLIFIFIIYFQFNCKNDKKEAVAGNKEEYRKVTCLENAYYIDNICEDEKEYLDWAKNYPEIKTFSEMNLESLEKLTKETQDVDKAAAVFYHRTIEEPKNKEFLDYIVERELEIDNTSPDYSKYNILLAMVPGMFYKQNQNQVDATGASIREIAREVGIQEVVVPTEETGTVTDNGKIICKFIEGYQANSEIENIILVSASKGGGDIKLAIQICGEESYFKKVKGWINMGGIIKGTYLVNEALKKKSYKWRARYYFWRMKYNWKGFLSMKKGEGAPLNSDLILPEHLFVINIIGVPLFRHVTQRARPFYLYLTRFGPSDGMTLLADSLIENSITYPSFRNDHYFTWAVPRRRIIAFIDYIIDVKLKK